MDNPPAFPAGWPDAGYEPFYGMTLRDWFAGQALGAIIEFNGIGRMANRTSAVDAYAIADAMLAERSKGV